jgi:hypothetical protein
MRDTTRISGKAAHPEPPPEVLDRAIPYKSRAEMLEDLDELGATRSQRWLFKYLHGAAQRFGEPATLESMRRIAEENDKPITTLLQALAWLVEHGFVARTTEKWGRNWVEVKWCLWLLPTSHQRPRRRAPAPPNPRMIPAATGRALFMGDGARFSGANDSNLLTQELKDDDCPRLSSFAPLQGEEDGGTRADRPRELTPPRPPTPRRPAPPMPIPAPPPAEIPPAVAAVIEAEVEDQGDRDDLAERAADWLTRCTVEWVVRIILEGVAARRKRAGTSRPVHNLAGYCNGILGNARRDGKVTLRAARDELPPSGKTPEVCRIENEAERLAAIERRQAEARTRARDDAIKARWDAMPPEGQRAVLEEYRAANPGTADQPPMVRKMLERQGCLEILAGREAVPS